MIDHDSSRTNSMVRNMAEERGGWGRLGGRIRPTAILQARDITDMAKAFAVGSRSTWGEWDSRVRDIGTREVALGRKLKG
jgi:hypothetical protein